MIPEYLHRFFWDVKPTALDSKKDERFIIERLLEKGDDSAVLWLKEKYPMQTLQEIASISRRLSPKSRNYWGIVLNIWSTLNQSAVKQGQIWRR